MPIIKITSIENKGMSMDGSGTMDSNPERTQYAFEILNGTFSEIIDSFKAFPPPWPWMNDVCLIKSALSVKKGIFVDVGGSARDLQIGQIINL